MRKLTEPPSLPSTPSRTIEYDLPLFEPKKLDEAMETLKNKILKFIRENII